MNKHATITRPFSIASHSTKERYPWQHHYTGPSCCACICTLIFTSIYLFKNYSKTVFSFCVLFYCSLNINWGRCAILTSKYLTFRMRTLYLYATIYIHVYVTTNLPTVQYSNTLVQSNHYTMKYNQI